MSAACDDVDQAHDAVVVGAGGTGPRAALGVAASGLRTTCIAEVFPTRSPMVAARGGIAAALGNMGDGDDRSSQSYDTIQCFDRVGDQDAIEHTCREAGPPVVERERIGGRARFITGRAPGRDGHSQARAGLSRIAARIEDGITASRGTGSRRVASRS